MQKDNLELLLSQITPENLHGEMLEVLKQAQVAFTQADSPEMLEFEKEMAYFYGAQNPKAIEEQYIKAIVELEQRGSDAAMIPHLKAAYEEVKKQTTLRFDAGVAAHHECKLIMAQSRQAPFEEIYQIMKDLYGEVFQLTSVEIDKAAYLRTFLYIYKIRLLNMSGGLTEDDKELLLRMARSSEKMLSDY